MLYMKSVSLNNVELEIIANALVNYPYLHTLDVSENRIEGKEGGLHLARIIDRKMNLKGGIQLNTLLSAFNNLGSKGFKQICKKLKNEGDREDTMLEYLDVRGNNIDNVLIKFSADRGYMYLRQLIMDDNKFNNQTYYRLS